MGERGAGRPDRLASSQRSASNRQPAAGEQAAPWKGDSTNRDTSAAGLTESTGMAFHRPTGSVAEAAIDVEGLFHRHYARLVAALTLVAGDRGAAEEAAQQAFVELWRHWDRVREYDHPQAWLMRSAVGRLRNERRRVGRLMRTLVRLSPAPDSLEAPTPLHAEIRDGFRRLPLRQREAASLYYILGLTTEEVAAAMKISAGAAASHIHRARAALCTYLEGQR